MVSLNGSPLANPLRFGLDLSGWLSKVVEAGADGDEQKERQRSNSIIVRTANLDRPASQASTAQSTSHSRPNSATSIRPNHSFVPARGGQPPQSQSHSSSPPPSPKTPLMPLALAAVVAVPTADGHLLEFDPFQTSPDEIDALQDISDSAKQQAKGDMRRLVAQAMERWKIA